MLLRQYGQALVEEPEPRTLLEYALFFFSMGLIFGTTFYFFDIQMNKFFKRMKYFSSIILIRSFLFLLIYILLISFSIFLFSLQDSSTFSLQLVKNYILSKEGSLTLFYLFLVSSFIQFIKQIDRKFGPGNLNRMIWGKFHTPKEVERMVMFIDLQSSTKIAEEIGHIKYSQLIQECFDLLGIIDSFGGEIYQYVGDEAVIIWEKKKGVTNVNCLNFYFTFLESIQKHKDHFKDNYQIIPKFKAGFHFGKVIMTEIGQIKREIAYHGDTMNTASRIQGCCNAKNQNILISASVKDILQKNKEFAFNFIDKVQLKGKSSAIDIYSVKNLLA
jgi:adenylate cyclase